MTPTPKLRWVERESFVKNGEAFRHPYKYKVLQQWWEASPHTAVGTELFHGRGEWRDVPVEEEK